MTHQTMMGSSARMFSEGPLYRAAMWVYITMVSTAALALVPVAFFALPSVVPMSGGAVVASQFVGALAVGPLAAATMYMLNRDRRTDDHTPVKDILRGLRLNTVEALAVWVPFVAVAGVVIVDLGAVASPWRIALLVLAALGALWASLALVVTAHFSFRLRDRLRLGAYYLFARPAVGLQLAALGVVLWWAAGISDVLPWLGSGVAIGLASWVTRPVVKDVDDRFTDGGSVT